MTKHDVHPMEILHDMTLRYELGERVVAEMFMENDRTPLDTVGAVMIRRHATIATVEWELEVYNRRRKEAA